MQGGKHGSLLIGACILLAAVVLADDDGGSLSTSSKLLSDFSSLSSPNNPAMELLDPFGIARQNRDIVEAAVRFPRPKDYIEAAIRLSLEQFKFVINKFVDVAKEADDSLNQMAVEDCRELMNYAIDELQESMMSVDQCPLRSLAERLADLKNWLSAVLSYSNTCIDGFTKPNLQSSISGFLRSCVAQTGQALSVVSAIPQILVGLNSNQTPSLHRHANPGATAATVASNEQSSGETTSAQSSFTSSGRSTTRNVNSAGSTTRNVNSADSTTGNMNAGGGTTGNVNTGDATERSLNEVHFPEWMKKSDRKLLMSKNGRGGGLRDSANVQPNAVVAKDGSGQYQTITDALNAYKPDQNNTRYVIYVKAGVYDEYILIPRKQTNIFMYGDGPTKTIVTGKKCNRDGISTFRTATFAVVGNGFICKSMGFQNTAGPEGHQAVALRVQSDLSAFYNCRMDGYQDTLYTQTHRQFYSNCVITGTVDFIFGDASAVIQNSVIIVRKPMDNQQNSVTAHGRTHNAEPTGLVIQNCQIVAEDGLEAKKMDIPSYLGRPWKAYSRTVIMHSTMGDFIRPEGWMPWAGDFGLDTCDYAEFGNRGTGADTSKRVTWKGYHTIKNANEAMKFTVERFIQGNHWLPATGAPYFLGLKSIE